MVEQYVLQLVGSWVVTGSVGCRSEWSCWGESVGSTMMEMGWVRIDRVGEDQGMLDG